jgi:hypothetical protein
LVALSVGEANPRAVEAGVLLHGATQHLLGSGVVALQRQRCPLAHGPAAVLYLISVDHEAANDESGPVGHLISLVPKPPRAKGYHALFHVQHGSALVSETLEPRATALVVAAWIEGDGKGETPAVGVDVRASAALGRVFEDVSTVDAQVAGARSEVREETAQRREEASFQLIFKPLLERRDVLDPVPAYGEAACRQVSPPVGEVRFGVGDHLLALVLGKEGSTRHEYRAAQSVVEVGNGAAEAQGAERFDVLTG